MTWGRFYICLNLSGFGLWWTTLINSVTAGADKYGKGSSTLPYMFKEGGGLAVVTRWFFGRFYGILLALTMSKLNCCFWNTCIMPVAALHARMKSEPGNAWTWTSPAASVVTSTMPSSMRGMVDLLASRINGGGCMCFFSYCTALEVVHFLFFLIPFLFYLVYFWKYLYRRAVVKDIFVFRCEYTINESVKKSCFQ